MILFLISANLLPTSLNQYCYYKETVGFLMAIYIIDQNSECTSCSKSGHWTKVLLKQKYNDAAAVGHGKLCAILATEPKFWAPNEKMKWVLCIFIYYTKWFPCFSDCP